ncbi:cytochrome c-552 (plasmid) [Thermus thermophilus]|uniref:Cytochrome c-552 n=1 Tax=Thermus thermophilus TaxID=274 RepID=A0AAD1KWE7_THETH|nr:cytochrome c [Thermus thermophilus]BBL83328.1 cytochrome c-552 [Thermus thermophilus]BBL85601.1 cytochrome c-552 [Thermus thermophilus]BCZ88054.1 cytochrome c-552 [Thermus thermophilus]BCZ90330.1 cytochrome c-552 [Thermus thermophilus]BCZ93040.1 cytochrome c-552 [Thermus thermophilus]
MRHKGWAYALAILGLGLSFAQTGQALYGQFCASCHQTNGQGLPKTFPPLAGHVQEILAQKDGRTYLMDVVLFGLQGAIQVKGQAYNGVMPAWGPQLKDDQIAAILNYLAQAFGNKPPKGFKPYTAAEVAKERAKKLTPDKVYALRKALKL